MIEITAKEQILKRIRNANINPNSNPNIDLNLESNIYAPLTDDLEIVFAQELNLLGGHFVYCSDKAELLENLKRLFEAQKWTSAHSFNPKIQSLLKEININPINKEENYSKITVGITHCESLIARLGSVMVSSKQISGRRINFISDTHIVIADRSQIVENIKDAMTHLQTKYNNNLPSMTTVISGPSRTADIEKTLVLGAHGPRSLIVFLTENNILN